MELGLASFYLDRRDLAAAAQQLDAGGAIGSEQTGCTRRNTQPSAEIELAFGTRIARRADSARSHPDRRAAGARYGAAADLGAAGQRLYAALAGVCWQKTDGGNEILALWERYRLRILGRPVPVAQTAVSNAWRPTWI